MTAARRRCRPRLHRSPGSPGPSGGTTRSRSSAGRRSSSPSIRVTSPPAERSSCARTATTSRSSSKRARSCSASRPRTSTATSVGSRASGSRSPLLADTDLAVAKRYGVKGNQAIPVKRSVFIIDATGVIRYRYEGTVKAIFKKPKALAKILHTI